MEIKDKLGLLIETVGKAAKAMRGRRLAPHETSRRDLKRGSLTTSGLTTETGDPVNPAAATALLHEIGLTAQPAGIRYALALADTSAVVAGLWIIAPVFTPTFPALCVALTLHLTSQRLISRKVLTVLTALLDIVSMFAVMLGVTGVIAGALTAVTTELPRYQRKSQILYQDNIHLLERLGDRFNIDMSLVTNPAQWAGLGQVTSYAGNLANSLGSAGTTMFYFTMLAISLIDDPVMMRHRAAELTTYAPGLAISLRKFV